MLTASGGMQSCTLSRVVNLAVAPRPNALPSPVSMSGLQCLAELSASGELPAPVASGGHRSRPRPQPLTRSPAAALRFAPPESAAEAYFDEAPSCLGRETGFPRHRVNGMSLSHPGTRGFGPQALDGLCGRLSALCSNARLNCRALRLATSASSPTDRSCADFVSRSSQRVPDPVGLRLQRQHRDKLRLFRRAAVVTPTSARPFRHLSNPGPPNQRQRQSTHAVAPPPSRLFRRL